VTSLIAQTIDEGAALAALVPEWWDLWHRAASATPFQSPAWLIAWWRHFHPGELFCVAVRDGRRLVALAPLYIEDGAFGRRLLPVGISMSDYLDVLLDPAVGREAGAALVRHLETHAQAWDGWDLEEHRQVIGLAVKRVWVKRAGQGKRFTADRVEFDWLV